MGLNNHFTAQQFIEAIPGTGGVITNIAKRVGCHWNTAQKYIKNYPTIKAAYDAECERVLDKAEWNVIAEIMDDQEPDLSLSKWYLTMKGRKRGYVTHRAEIGAGEGAEVKIYLPDNGRDDKSDTNGNGE